MRLRFGVVKKKAQLLGQLYLIGSFQTGATDHGVNAMVFDIGPNAAPKHFNRAFAAIISQNAGATKFKETRIWMLGEQRADIELLRGIKTEVSLCNFMP